MKNTKLIGIIAVAVAIVLLALGFVLGFERGVDVGGAYTITVSLNDDFDVSEIEAVMKEAGASEVLVQQEYSLLNSGDYKAGEAAVISFDVVNDEDVDKVFEKAEELLGEKFFLKFDGELSYVASTLNKARLVSMWPALIVVVVLLAYTFIRFGVSMGITVILTEVVTLASTCGLIGITGLKVTGYTIPAIMLTAAFTYVLALVFALFLKDNRGKLEGVCQAYAVAEKQTAKLAAVLSALAVAALAVVCIFGGVMLKNFALTALIGTVISAAAVIFVMPAMASMFKKA